MAVLLQWFGRGWSSWPEFRSELARRGINANEWIRQYPQAAMQIGAPGGSGRPPGLPAGYANWGEFYAHGGQAPFQGGGGGGGGGGGAGGGGGGSGGAYGDGGISSAGTNWPLVETDTATGLGIYQSPDGGYYYLDPNGAFYPVEGSPSGGDGGGGGGGGGGAYPPETGQGATGGGYTGPTDWSSMLSIAGLPADVQAEINRIVSGIADVNQAVAAAMAFVRGTPWYKQTFVGIDAGIQKGLFTDERGYRDYRNQLENVYREWGQPFSQESLLAAFGEGVDVSTVSRRFQGRKWAEANRADVQFVSGAFGPEGRMSQDDVRQLGETQAGLGSPRGAVLERALRVAQERMQRAFDGVAANPQLALTSFGKLFGPGASENPGRPDIAA